MSDLSNEYIFEQTGIAGLSYALLLNHCTETIQTSRKELNEIRPLEIDLNAGVFYKPASKVSFPEVTVRQQGNSLLIHCPCSSPKVRLCPHQAQVLYTILETPDYRAFFDEALRRKKIETIALAYGLQDVSNPDEYFRLQYNGNILSIEPRQKGLVRVIEDELKQALLPGVSDTLPAADLGETTTRRIMVLKRHKYYELLNIELFEGETTQTGKIKNPLTVSDPKELIYRCANLEEARFYSAVSHFQQGYTIEKPEPDIAALKIVLDNPLGLDIFYHNRQAGENINAHTITPVALQVLQEHVQLSVAKKEPFYEVTGGIMVQGSLYPFKQLQVVFTYFLKIGGTCYLVPNAGILKLIRYFQAHNQILLVHASKFVEFKQTVLANLERQVNIRYAFIKPASPSQLAEKGFDERIEKIIYLSDRQPYISLTPVIKYGSVEIPVFSRKQIYDTDANGNEFRVERDEQLEVQFTSLIMRQHPEFEEQVQEHEFFYLHKSKFLDENWFLNAFEAWRDNGIVIFGFNEIKKNRLNAHKAVVSVKVGSGIDWFKAQCEVAFGNQKASLKQLYKAIRNKSRFVVLDDGTQGLLPAGWISKFEDYFKAGEIADDSLLIPKTNFGEMEGLFGKEVLGAEITGELKAYDEIFSGIKALPEAGVPAGLHATLRDYQKQGLNWLNLMDKLNFGACLADDMGLGKTLQIIAFILLQRKKEARQANLIVVPTSLLFNWQAEVEKFAPSLRLFTHYGINRVRNTRHFGQYEIILTTYGTLLGDIRWLKEYRFNYIFLDESQAIKNPDSERYKAARLLVASNRVVITGTPVENNTFDIYGQLSFACPGLLGSRQHFRDIYSIPIDKFKNSKRALSLRQKISPFILRRTKRQVAEELPEKTEMVLYCEMGENQRKLYNACEKELRDYLEARDEEEISGKSMHVLTGLTKLRLICNSPLLLKDEAHFGDASAKIEALMEQIENKSTQHKILIFSQFVSMLDLIRKALAGRNIPFEYLTGQTKDRAARIAGFRENDSVRVFLISLKAGGTGLNLTEADYVYVVDPWWNPAVENQAIDRCYRIGQTKHVVAVRLICPDTVEERIMKLQQAKTKLANDLITSETSVFKSLSKTDLIGLLK